MGRVKKAVGTETVNGKSRNMRGRRRVEEPHMRVIRTDLVKRRWRVGEVNRVRTNRTYRVEIVVKESLWKGLIYEGKE